MPKNLEIFGRRSLLRIVVAEEFAVAAVAVLAVGGAVAIGGRRFFLPRRRLGTGFTSCQGKMTSRLLKVIQIPRLTQIISSRNTPTIRREGGKERGREKVSGRGGNGGVVGDGWDGEGRRGRAEWEGR